MRFRLTYLFNIMEKDSDYLEIDLQQHFSFPREMDPYLFFIAINQSINIRLFKDQNDTAAF